MFRPPLLRDVRNALETPESPLELEAMRVEGFHSCYKLPIQYYPFEVYNEVDHFYLFIETMTKDETIKQVENRVESKYLKEVVLDSSDDDSSDDSSDDETTPCHWKGKRKAEDQNEAGPSKRIKHDDVVYACVVSRPSSDRIYYYRVNKNLERLQEEVKKGLGINDKIVSAYQRSSTYLRLPIPYYPYLEDEDGDPAEDVYFDLVLISIGPETDITCLDIDELKSDDKDES
ncbi:MAG: hypothetical protein ACYCQJ_13930 [Nitrososphaerales archaeon]